MQTRCRRNIASRGATLFVLLSTVGIIRPTQTNDTQELLTAVPQNIARIYFSDIWLQSQKILEEKLHLSQTFSYFG